MSTSPFQLSLTKLLATHGSRKVPQVSVAVRADGAETTATDGCTPGTLFQAASISKPIAALAALALVREGQLKLDDLVNTKLTTWKLASRTVARGAPTLRQLLSHTAGVNVRAYPGYPHGTTPPAIRDILVGGPAINTPPTVLVANAGAGEMYSGGGYTVLQCLLEDVTRKPLPDLVKTLVFDPLRMTSARYAEPLPKEAAPATVHGGLVPGGWRRYPELAAAGLWCTAMDLVRFGAGIQDAVAGVSGAILPAKLAMEMVTRPGEGFGLGVELAGSGTGRRFGHGGQNEGYLCELTATIGPGPVIVVMTASDRGNDVLHPLVPAIRKLTKWPDPAATAPQGGPPDPPIASSDVEMLATMYSRTYETDSKERLQLTGNCYNWTLTKAGQAGVAFEALDATTLASLDRSQRIEFTVDSARQPTKITITGPTGPVTAKPV